MSSTTLRYAALVAVLTEILLAIAAPSALVAQDADALAEARMRQSQGEAYFEAENYDAALVEFERVYELLDGQPARYLVQFNIGQCQERLFRYDAALQSYRAYLSEGGEGAEDRPMVEGLISALDGMLASLTIEANVENGEIWVDDRMLGTAPGVVRVPPGNHSVEVRAPEFSPDRQEVSLSTHASRTMTFTLEPLGQPSGIHPAFFIGGSVATAVVLAVGIGFGVEALSTHDAVARAAGSPDAAQWGSVYQGDLAHIADLALTADVLYGVAGALAVGSVVMLLVTNWGSEGEVEPTTSLRLTPVVGPRELGIDARGTF